MMNFNEDATSRYGITEKENMMDKQPEGKCVVQKEIGNTTYVIEIKESDFESLGVEDRLLNIVIEGILKAS